MVSKFLGRFPAMKSRITNRLMVGSILGLTLAAGLLLRQSAARADDPDTPPDGWTLIQVFSGERDACSPNNVVSIPGRKGRVEVRRGETRWVVLESIKATFYWRCGDTEEKFEYGDVQPFNAVKVERSADTGRISWTCYLGLPASK